MLCSLHESWDHFATSINFSTSRTLEFDDVVGVLLSEEMMKISSIQTSPLEVKVARGWPKESVEQSRDLLSSKSKGKNSKIRCWYYNKIGHLKKYCWKRKESEGYSKKEVNLVE